jgi:hypothetical protein
MLCAERLGLVLPAAERGDRADTRHGHEPADLRIITCQPQNLTIEIVGLLLDGLTLPVYFSAAL